MALTVYNGNLIAGGNSTTAGGNVSAFWASWGPSCLLGDMNCDTAVDAADIDLFVAGLLDPPSIDECTRLVADMNSDSVNDAADIAAFVACVLAGGC